MRDSELPERSRKKSFFDDESMEDSDHGMSRDGMDENRLPPNPNQPYPNGRERMTSRYREEEDEEDYEENYDRRGRAGVFSFLQGLFHGDSSTRRLAFAAAGIGGALLFFIGGWMMFRTGHQGVPVIEPPKQAAKEKPPQDGNAATIGMDKGDNPVNANGQPTLAPGPEQANPSALAAQYGNGASAKNKPDTVAAGNHGQASLSPSGGNGVTEGTGSGSSVSANSVPVNKGDTEQETQLKPVSPVSKVGSDDESEPTTVAPVKPRHEARKKPVSKKTPAVRKEGNGKVGNGHYMVQLAALGSSHAAEKQWQVMLKKAPGLLGKYTPAIQKAEIKGSAVYRLRIKGFASKAQASGFCGQLKAKNLSCTLANF